MPLARPFPGRSVVMDLLIAAAIPLLITGCGSSPPSPSPMSSGKLVIAATLNERQQLFLVVGATGQLTPITEPPFADGVPVWSPDGSSIAFVRFSESGASGLHIVQADGLNDRALTSSGSASDILPTWSPDGRQIAFARVTGNGGQASDSALFVINADGTGPTQVTHDPDLPNDPVWAPDGSLIAYDAGRGANRTLFVVRPNGDGIRSLSAPLGGLMLDWPLIWSPNSSELAFAAASPDAGHHVFVLDLAGHVRDISSGPGDDGPPAWAPDGAQLAFWSDRDGEGDIYAVSRGGGNLRRLTTDSHLTGVTTLAWSPDGGELVVWNSPADTAVSRNYVLSAAGGTLRPLLPKPAAEFMALWHP